MQKWSVQLGTVYCFFLVSIKLLQVQNQRLATMLPRYSRFLVAVSNKDRSVSQIMAQNYTPRQWHGARCFENAKYISRRLLIRNQNYQNYVRCFFRCRKSVLVGVANKLTCKFCATPITPVDCVVMRDYNRPPFSSSRVGSGKRACVRFELAFRRTSHQSCRDIDRLPLHTIKVSFLDPTGSIDSLFDNNRDSEQ